jgi:hypothetical protein
MGKSKMKSIPGRSGKLRMRTKNALEVKNERWRYLSPALIKYGICR